VNLRKTFAENLKKIRRARGWSQEELAHRADIDRTYVSLLERQIYSATLDVISKLAVALEVEPSELLKRNRKINP
jgi:transcriptional regulator with XRE-family HTH domain